MFKTRSYIHRRRWDRDNAQSSGVIAAWAFFSIPVLIGIVALYASLAEFNRARNVIEGPFYRAVFAPEATDMVERLDVLLAKLREEGLIQGNTWIIFGTPATDQALVYKDLEGYRDRAQRVAENTSLSSAEMGIHLNDIRASVQLLFPGWAGGVWWHSSNTALLAAMFFASIVAVFIAYHIVDPTVKYWMDELRNRSRPDTGETI